MRPDFGYRRIVEQVYGRGLPYTYHNLNYLERVTQKYVDIMQGKSTLLIG